MYASHNFKTKKALKEAVEADTPITVISPGPFPAPTNGQVSIEGPWAPARHTWYANCTVQHGRIIRVR